MSKQDTSVFSHATQAEVSNFLNQMQRTMKISDIHMQMYLVEHTASLIRKVDVELSTKGK